MKKKLTKTVVEKAEPRAKRYEIRDTELLNFLLRVSPTGLKAYFYEYKNKYNERKTYKIGTPKEFAPDAARNFARDLLQRIRGGEDPAGDKVTLKEAPSIADLKITYMVEHGDYKRSKRNDIGYWNNWLLPAFGKIKCQELTRQQLNSFMRSHPKKTTANRCLQVLSKAYELAIHEWEWFPELKNPCEKIKKFPEKKRKRYITPEELGRLKTALQMYDVQTASMIQDKGTHRRFAQMIRLLLMTGARLRNIMDARWEWVHWNMSAMIIPIEEHKTGEELQEPLVIHLSQEAIRILRELKDEDEHNSEWIIYGRYPSNAGISGYRKFWLSLIEIAGITNLTIHDLRHSYASLGLSAGLSLEQIGELLGHKSTQTTKRYTHLQNEQALKSVDAIANQIQL